MEVTANLGIVQSREIKSVPKLQVSSAQLDPTLFYPAQLDPVTIRT